MNKTRTKRTKGIKVGIVGATGLVGQTFIKQLLINRFPVSELRLFASDNSTGRLIPFKNKSLKVERLTPQCFENLDMVFFSAGNNISLKWAPKAVEAGAFAIDNSSAFRMSKDHLLIVPEVNGDLLKNLKPQIIANPNCSTIQLVVALKPIQLAFGLKDVRVASYQAVSGAGKQAIDELLTQVKKPQQKIIKYKTFPRPIAYNCIPQIGEFEDSGFCVEEVKIMQETQKILTQTTLSISAFTVRIPALNSHSEAVWFTTKHATSKSKLEQVLKRSCGIILSKETKEYPTAHQVSGSGSVYVGRLHKIPSPENTWLMWVVADNLLKGAALNSLQIAERIFDI